MRSSRWTRLLFGREFPFEDVLRLWDYLFAEKLSSAIMDMMCVSMLLRLRWQCEQIRFGTLIVWTL